MAQGDSTSTDRSDDKIDGVGLGSIIAAHAAVDMQTMSLNTLLPSLLATFSLNYATAAAIITMNQIVIAVFQPVAGIIGDKRAIRWLALFGCALCGLMMASVTFLPSYWMIVIAAALSGVGSALFHPEALKHARNLSGKYTTTGTSWFFLGGNIGFGVAPLLVGFLIERFGTHAASWMIVPTILGCALLLWQMRKFKSVIGAASAASAEANAEHRRNIALFVAFVLFLIILRSISYEGMKTFMPLYFANETGKSTSEFAPLLTSISLSGIVGTIFSGPLADRIGRRNLMVISMAVALGALFMFWRSEGLLLQVIWIGIFGIAMTAPWTISVTMVQDAMPNQLGLAGGLTLGTAYGASGLGVGALGLMANSIGIWPTMQFIAVIPAVVLLLSIWVPERVKHAPVIIRQAAASGK